MLPIQVSSPVASLKTSLSPGVGEDVVGEGDIGRSETAGLATKTNFLTIDHQVEGNVDVVEWVG